MTLRPLGQTKILCGDALARLRELPAGSVHCVVTSPPYWSLRDYGTGRWVGGDPACEHKKTRWKPGLGRNGRGDGAGCTNWGLDDVRPTRYRNRTRCSCGAELVDAQLGLEATPEEYVARMVAVFREVRRVLRDDGTLWLNMGDCYASSPPGNQNGVGDSSTLRGASGATYRDTLKPKDLVGIPWRLALALQADGWWLRRDIIWAKGVSFCAAYSGSIMPESVEDRPATSHEYLFLLTKSARYFYDGEAVREVGVLAAGTRSAKGSADRRGMRGVNARPPEYAVADGTRNLRSVWAIATRPFPDAHFATFPPALVEPCVKAGTSERGCCPKCGVPWVRQVERGALASADGTKATYRPTKGSDDQRVKGRSDGRTPNHSRARATTGWQPSCECGGGAGGLGDAVEARPYAPVPCVVLDPFLGSGTTALVANGLGRDAVGIELSGEYVKLATKRLRDAFGMFAHVEVEVAG